ncbi:MAG: hypothetical protein AAB955_00405 [Patescibacteria group bacterium]
MVFPKALALLKQLRFAQLGGKQVGEILIYSKYNFWHCFEQLVLFNELIPFYKGQLRQPARPFPLKAHILGLCMAVYTLLSLPFLLRHRLPVMIYSVDKTSSADASADFRLAEVYRILEETGVPYVECFHTLFNKSFLVNAANRRRAALYREAIDWVYYLALPFKRVILGRVAYQPFVMKGVSEAEREVAELVVREYLATAPLFQFRVAAFRLLLKILRPRIIVMIDDVRHTHELLIAAAACGIPTVMVQHGHFTPYHVGWQRGEGLVGTLIRSDTLVVWSEYWKQELLRLGSQWPDTALLVGGNATAPASVAAVRSSAPGYRVLIPYEVEAPFTEVSAYIVALRALGAEVILKLRPDKPAAAQLAPYGVADMATTTSFSGPYDAVMGTYSTLLYDALAVGIPVGIFETSLDYGQGMLVNKLALPVRLATLAADLEALKNISENDMLTRTERLRGPTLTKEFLTTTHHT